MTWKVKKKRKTMKPGAATAATIEQAEDGSWTASAHVNEHLVLGDGDTKEEAIEDVRKGLESLVEYLNTGENSPQGS
jgi:predicted RNase H-like HicB family nuclease